ncbi:MAG: phage baseplate assembly protein V [Pseudomonadota bacterium]
MSAFPSDVDRRIEALVNVGTVIAVDQDAATVRVQVGAVTTPHIPVAQVSAGAMQFWFMPSVGEQVGVLAPGGDFARAMVVGSFYAGNQPSNNRAEPYINLAGGRMVIDGDLIVTGKVVFQDTLSVAGQTTCDADVVASGVSLKTHRHGGVRSGSAQTGEPA